MKKKLISALLCSAMAATLVVGCGAKEEDNAGAAGTTTGTTEPVTAGSIPQDYVHYYSFDQASDIDAIQTVIRDNGNIVEAGKEKKYIGGVKGDAIFTDGLYGFKLSDVNGVGDSYTVSYWTYCRRSSLYMPNTIWGPDIHGDKSVGGELWAAFDWLASEEDSAKQNFPSVWSNDGLGVGRAAWTTDGTDDGTGKWIHLAMVIDANSVSADGSFNVAKVYINGQEYEKTANGEVVPINVVKGTMNASDSFEFLLGINYWDTNFKGAFDELYIYDYALDASQIAALYADGNSTAAYVEPERIITVAPTEGAIATLGTTDYKADEDQYTTESYAIKDGETYKFNLKNWSDGLDSKNNYIVKLATEDAEVGTLYADADGVFADGTSAEFTWNWGNWGTWLTTSMVEADVEIAIKRDGNTITVTSTANDVNLMSNISTAVITTDVDPETPINVSFTNKNSFVELLKVKNATVAAGGIVVGATDCTTGFWSEFSGIFAIPEGQSVTKTFTNYTSGAENWNNFVCILQNTPNGHAAADVEGYAEYAVVRADNYGWGVGYDGIVTPECDWNWDTFKEDMNGAKVNVTITNNGSTADIAAVVTTQTGAVYHQNYNGIAIDGDLYACFTVDGSSLSFDSAVVGATDCTTGFWSNFSDIYAVPNGESKTIYFKNLTSGVENWNNFVAILQSTPDAHSAEMDADYKEYGVVRADNYGWGAGYDGIAVAECNWNWDTFKDDMANAYVALTVTNNGSTADIVANVLTESGSVYTQSYTGIAIDGDLYFCLTVDGSCVMIEGEQVGKADCTDGFWTKFSSIYPVAEGETVTKSFTNYTSGVENWNNFVVILQNTPTGHAATDAEGYAEYAVVRADNYGWGVGYDGIAVLECDWNWDTFKEDMNGANVVLNVTNNGSTADIVAVITTAAGKVFHQSYTDIAVDGDLYFCLTVDGSSAIITQ